MEQLATQSDQVGGKWSSGQSLDEQAETVHVLQEHFTFDNSYEYNEDDLFGSRFGTATVRGFWLEECQSNLYKWEFVANMELNKNRDKEMVEVRFPFDEEANGFIDRNWALKEYLKIFGVNSDNIGDILGRKCLYEDNRSDTESNDFGFGLSFFNSRRTQLTYDLQKVSVGIMILSTIAILPAGMISPLHMLLAIGGLCFGLALASVEMIRRRFDHHGMMSVKNYLIQDE